MLKTSRQHVGRSPTANVWSSCAGSLEWCVPKTGERGRKRSRLVSGTGGAFQAEANRGAFDPLVVAEGDKTKGRLFCGPFLHPCCCESASTAGQASNGTRRGPSDSPITTVVFRCWWPVRCPGTFHFCWRPVATTVTRRTRSRFAGEGRRKHLADRAARSVRHSPRFPSGPSEPGGDRARARRAGPNPCHPRRRAPAG